MPSAGRTGTSSTRSRTVTSCAAPVLGMALDLAALGPGVGGVVVVDIAEEQAGGGLVNDEADVVAG